MPTCARADWKLLRRSAKEELAGHTPAFRGFVSPGGAREMHFLLNCDWWAAPECRGLVPGGRPRGLACASQTAQQAERAAPSEAVSKEVRRLLAADAMAAATAAAAAAASSESDPGMSCSKMGRRLVVGVEALESARGDANRAGAS